MWQELKIKLNVDPVGLSALLEALKARVTSVLKFEGADFMSSMAAKVIHSVSYVYAILPFYDVKYLCSGGRKWGRKESHSH